MIQDGWSDSHNTPVIASCVHTGDNAYFVSSVDSGSNKKTTTYCGSVPKNFMQEAEEKFGCNVIGVVRDNGKKMEAMCKEQSLIVYGCSSHWLNLLGQDIIHPAVVPQIVEVNKYFRNHHVPNAFAGNHQ